ncbi:glycosyltransferase family A protein [Nigerium massiliense]|uniref:glycosyltransferase family A protein n=1 Tax=Nigerium massiliense TaxID=1522317 RepID=UPI0011C90F34|nr:glycosyltransferase family A protein [Nigerium massiliense]
MSHPVREAGADPWAWARADETADDAASGQDAAVTAVVVTHNGARWLEDLLASLAEQTLPPSRIVAVDTGSTDRTAALLEQALADDLLDAVVRVPEGSTVGAAARAGLELPGEPGEFVWLLHDDVEAAPDALERLVSRLRHRPDADAATPLLVQPHRRGAPAHVSELGQTVTRSGVVRPVVGSGTIDQGQLDSDDVLGANACGLLVRRSSWDALGGLNADVASAAQGVEFGWLAGLAGGGVVTEPAARLVHWEASTRGIRAGAAGDPLVDRRRWGMALHEAFRGRPAGPLRVGTGSSALGRAGARLLGKDPATAALELRALAARRRADVAVLRHRYEQLDSTPGDVGALRPTRRQELGRASDDLFGRVASWGAGFADGPRGASLDTLTGDEYAGGGAEDRRTPRWVVVTGLLVVAAFVAAWRLYSPGPLQGPQLLPAHDSMGAMLGDVLDPIAGVGTSSGPPWLGLTWLASWLTLGHPDALVSLVLLGCVPLAFLLARRTLRRLVADRGVALSGALAYALAPILTGAVGSGQWGAVLWTLLLPVAAHQLIDWWDARPSWSTVGAFALTATLMTAVEPLSWPLLALSVLTVCLAGRRGWLPALVAVASPALVAVSPWAAMVAERPGRLLTGTDPVLAPLRAPDPWQLFLARPAVEGLAPLAVSAVAVGALWLAALIGVGRRPARASWGLALAGLGLAAAVVLTRFVVPVPPDGFARPQGTVWLVLFLAGLVVAATTGLDGLAAGIKQRSFGGAHVALYLLRALLAVGVLAAGAWWVIGGLAPLSRGAGVPVAPYLQRETESGLNRTLALRDDGGDVRWSLREGAGPRLGQPERGVALGGHGPARELAGSVAQRLATGSADDQLLADLRALGVGHVWLEGGDPELRTGIANVPGLGSGSADATTVTWTVPGSGRAVVVVGQTRTPVAPGALLEAGPGGRTLTLAEVPDDRWWAAVGGRRLPRAQAADGSVSFQLPASGGVLEVGFDSAAPWWAWVQLAGLAGLAVLALPALAPQSHRPAPRRLRRAAR